MRFLYARAKLACEAGRRGRRRALLAGRVAGFADGAVVAVISGGNVSPEVAAAILSGA